MKRSVGLILVASMVFSAGIAVAANPKWWQGSLTVENESDYDIHHFYLAPAHKTKWGKDWLGKEVLSPGETLTITGLDCTDYDIKLIDEEGDVCVIEDIDFCQEDLSWEVTNRVLQNCSGWTK